MYTPTSGRLAFGSVITARWLFDIYVRQDSAALSKTTFAGGHDALVIRREAPHADDFMVATAATMDETDLALAHGGQRLALVLTDDCELASLAGERADRPTPRGRILMAGIRSARDEELKVARTRTANLRNFVLEPDEATGFEGCIADFTRLYSVHAQALFGANAAAYTIHAQLDRDAQLDLANRFGGFALRHGPLAASIGARKLSQLLTANGDPEVLKALRAPDPQPWGDADVEASCRALLSVIEEAWFIDGALLDDVDTVAERALLGQSGQVPVAEVEAIVAALTKLRDGADAAIAGLQRAPGSAS